MTRVPSASSSVGKWIGGALFAGAMGLYVSGHFFLHWIKQAPDPLAPLATMAAPLRYWHHYGDRADVRQKLLGSLGGGLGLAFGGVGLALAPRRRPLHGNAQFATHREMKKRGLFGSDGIFMGIFRGKFLMLTGQRSLIIEGPPRSGKGRCIIVPTLLLWRDSLFSLDPKKENYGITGGYRAKFQPVFCFEPLSPTFQSDRYNVCDPIPVVPSREEAETMAAGLGIGVDDLIAQQTALQIDEIMRISSIFFPRPGRDSPFWVLSARDVFEVMTLYLFETPGSTRTIGEILRQGMAGDNDGFGGHWKKVMKLRQSEGRPLSPLCTRILWDLINCAPQTLSGIRKEFTTTLGPWKNPLIDAATSASDFRLDEMREKRFSVYAVIGIDQIETLRPLLRVMLSQLIGLNTRKLPEHDKKLKYKLLINPDELAMFGHVPELVNAAAFFQGYNIVMLAAVQSFHQLVSIYGPNDAAAFRKMLAARIAFAPKEFDEAKALSDALGTYTVKQKSSSRPTLFGGSKGGSVSTSDQRRPLMLPQEVMAIDEDHQLLFCERMPPALTGRIRHDEHPVFSERANWPTPTIRTLKIVLPVPVEVFEEPGRKGTAADIPTLGSKKLGDFKGDFAAIEVPAGELTDAEVQRVADSFLATLGA